MKRVLIAGGGVIGLMTAYYLSEAGHEVVVIDKSNFRDNCSHGNAGLIVPSHFVPLAAPGIVMQGIKWIFNPESPFSMNFRPDFNLFRWALRFWYSSNNKHVKKSAPVLLSFNQLSKELYKDLSSVLPEIGLKHNGLLMLCNTDEKLEEEYKLATMASELGYEAQRLNPEGVCEIQDNMNIKVKGGVFYPGDSQLSPQNLADSLFKFLQAKGVKLISDTNLEKIALNKNKAYKAITNNGDFTFDEMVLATGVLSYKLFKQFKIKTLLQPGKGYSFNSSTNDLIKVPAILVEARVAITPYSSYTRFSGAMEIGNLNRKINSKKIQGMVKSIRTYFPAFDLKHPGTERIWAGFRPCSFDGLPYIGRIAGLNNVILATGHSMMGVSLAPATGKIIEELISDKTPSFDISLFNPER